MNDVVIKIRNQRVLPNTQSVVADSRNYQYVTFDFDEDWNDILKTAIFVNDKIHFSVLLDDTNRCLIPEAVLKSGTLKVSVYGGDRLTATNGYLRVLKSGYEDAPEPPEPSIDIYDQLVELASKAVYTANKIQEEAESGKFNGEKGDTPVKGVDYWTEEDKKEIINDVLAEIPNGDEVTY